MKLTAFLTTLACAELTLGARFTEQRRARAAARSTSSHPRLPVTDVSLDELSSNDTHADYSSNWAGAVLIGSGYKSVTGTFVVPTPKAPSGGSSNTEYAASAWVGIDGDTASNSILQTGIDFYVQGGEIGFDAWYEWFPDYAYNFNGISINAGDTITVT
jgi:hypothetical protein